MDNSIELVGIKPTTQTLYHEKGRSTLPAIELTIRNVGSRPCARPVIICGSYARNGDTLGKHPVQFPDLEPGGAELQDTRDHFH